MRPLMMLNSHINAYQKKHRRALYPGENSKKILWSYAYLIHYVSKDDYKEPFDEIGCKKNVPRRLTETFRNKKKKLKRAACRRKSKSTGGACRKMRKHTENLSMNVFKALRTNIRELGMNILRNFINRIIAPCP
jgi:hypothetical protein